MRYFIEYWCLNEKISIGRGGREEKHTHCTHVSNGKYRVEHLSLLAMLLTYPF